METGRRRRWALLFLLALFLPVAAVAAYALRLVVNAAGVPDYRERAGNLVESTVLERYRFEASEIQRIALRSNTGIRFEIALRVPDTPLPGRPLVVLLAGNETGHGAATMIRNPGGIAVAALSYPFREIPYREFWPMVRALPDIQRGIINTPAAVLLAIDYLAHHDALAPERIELAGVSFGAYLAPAAASYDRRIDRLWLIHGSADPEGVIRYGLRERLPWPALASPMAAFLARVAGAEFLAPELWLERLGGLPLVLVSARADESLPIAAVKQLHTQAPAGTPILWTEGDHVHPKRPQIMDALSHMLREAIEASVPPPTSRTPRGSKKP